MIKKLLFLFLLLISFTSCVEKITRIVHQETISPEYSIDKEVLKNRISDIISAEDINISSSITTRSGEEELHILNVEILPDSLPSSGIAFYRKTGEIKTAVESGVNNMSDYQKLRIIVRRQETENGVEHSRSYKKDIDL